MFDSDLSMSACTEKNQWIFSVFLPKSQRQISHNTHHAHNWLEEFVPWDVHPRHLDGAGIPWWAWSKEVFNYNARIAPWWPSNLNKRREEILIIIIIIIYCYRWFTCANAALCSMWRQAKEEPHPDFKDKNTNHFRCHCLLFPPDTDTGKVSWVCYFFFLPSWSEWLTEPSWPAAWARPWRWRWHRHQSNPPSFFPEWWSQRPSARWVWSPDEVWTWTSARAPRAEGCRSAFQT